MKKISIILVTISLLVVNSVFAQKSDSTVTEKNKCENKTIFSNLGQKPKVSGFAAINFDIASAESKIATYIGVDYAILFNRSLYFGLYGRMLAASPKYNYYANDSIGNAIRNGMFFHLGGIIGANFFATRPVHFGFSTKFGGGAYTLFDKAKVHTYDTHKSKPDDIWVAAPLIVITPQLDIEMNVTQWFKFRVGVGYQWVSSSTIDYRYDMGGYTENRRINTSALSTPIVEISFVLGWFK